MFSLGIKNYNIRIGTNSNSALAREQPKDLCRSGGGHFHEFVQPDTDILPVTPDEPTAVNPAPVAAITEPDAAATDEMPDSEPAPAVSEATDIEPEALAPTEMEPLTPVTPADESPAAPADDDLL